MPHYQGHFLFFHLIPNTWYLNAWLKSNNLNSCMSKSICAEWWCWVDMTKFRLAYPCQNKESKQKKHDNRDKRNANECLFNTSLCSEMWQTPFPMPRKSILTSPFEMVHARPCMANRSCNWCQKKEHKLNFVTM